MAAAHLRPRPRLACEEVFRSGTLPAAATVPDVGALQKGLGEQRHCTPEVLSTLLRFGRDAFAKEPNVVEIPATPPTTADAPARARTAIIGPVRGQYFDMLRIFSILEASASTSTAGGSAPASGVIEPPPPTPEQPFTNVFTEEVVLPPGTNVLFLGDVVDGGPHSLEVLLLLVALKLKYPSQVHVLRGRRESRKEHDPKGHSVLLQTQLMRLYGADDAEKLWEECWALFCALPIAAVVGGKYWCASGGIGPGCSVAEVNAIPRGDDPLRQSLLCDVVWSDPMDDEDEDLQASALFLHNHEKGVGYNYSFNAVMHFLTDNNYMCMIRGLSFPDNRETSQQVTRQSHNSSGRPWHYQYSCYDPGYRLYRRNPTNGFPCAMSLFSAPRFLNENENKGGFIILEGDKLEIKQFPAAPRPYWLPRLANGLEWSLPHLIRQATAIGESLWNVCNSRDDDPLYRAQKTIRANGAYDKRRARLLAFQKLCKLVNKKDRAEGNMMMLNGLSGFVEKDEAAAAKHQQQQARGAPFLRPPVYYEIDRFERLRVLQENWRAIRDECAAVWKERVTLDLHRPSGAWVGGNADEFVAHYSQQRGWIPSYQAKSGRNYLWLNYGLMHNGSPFAENAATCPKTMALIEQINKIAKVRVCGFSAMLPGAEIKPHRDQAGVLDNALAFHLGLIVPPTQECFLVVDNQPVAHKEGEVIIFDSTYTHSAYNKSDADRIVLYVDFQLSSTDPIKKYV